MLNEGFDVAAVARHRDHHHRWQNQHRGVKADDAMRLKKLERENAQLKRLADKELENLALGEIVSDTPIDQVVPTRAAKSALNA